MQGALKQVSTPLADSESTQLVQEAALLNLRVI
jgi:hypothetical protein